jgi:hypothetical protein
MSSIFEKFTEDVIISVTELINKYSSEFIKFNLNDLIYEVFMIKINMLYSRKNLEEVLKNNLVNFEEVINKFVSEEEQIKLQKSILQKDMDYIKTLEESISEANCIQCKNNLRSVIFLPCRHLLICQNCLSNLDFKLNSFCNKCEDEVKDFKIVSLNN